jgi:hypothetical protein
MIEVLKQAYQLLLTEPHAPTVCDQLEVIFRRAIAELESQEPVGYVAENGVVDWNVCAPPILTDLYTHPLAQPPQRTWVGLTKDEVDSWNLPDHPTVFEFAQFIESKLKEKNI